jgi:capsular exopolysaccharide synthesis family protein
MSSQSLHGHLDESLITYFRPDSVEAEQFRKLAANIIFQKTESHDRCLMVTSATQGEGKSFLTANLAVSLAKSLEEPVLLVDCDLRKPQMHKTFGCGEVPGLSDHFSKGIDLSALIRETSIDHLRILPAGTKSFHSAELLSSERTVKILNTLKSLQKEGVILIDSPPPLGTAEPIAIARWVDKVILVVKCEATPRAMVEDLIKAIGKDVIMGTVLNRARHRVNTYYRYGS